MVEETDIEQKLAAARTRLLMERPFLGALGLRLPLIAAEWCQTTATDARAIYYNPDFIGELSLRDVQFMLAHDTLHNALSHFNRRAGRDRRRWDIACDFSVNAMLVQDGMFPPPQALYLEAYHDMTAEEIYPMIAEDSEDETLDDHSYEQPSDGSQQPPPLTEHERQNLDAQWRQRLASAALQAEQAGKLGKVMKRMIEVALEPRLPWRNLLQRYLYEHARDDYSLFRPSSRREGSAIYPSMHSEQGNIAVVVDTSGSLAASEVREFIDEITALKGQLRASLLVMACDEELVIPPKTYDPWEEVDGLTGLAQGGRGTSFVPPFTWLQDNGKRPDVLVYFTDADGVFPPDPGLDVIWLVKGKARVPWGRRIQLA
jgi:predicted metal-dependent peptidase